MKKVEVHLLLQSEPIICEDVKNTYEKGNLFCVMYKDGRVDKFPTQHIFRIREHPPTKK